VPRHQLPTRVVPDKGPLNGCAFCVSWFSSPSCRQNSDECALYFDVDPVTRRVHWSRASASRLDWLPRNRSVNAQRVLDTCIPMRGLFTLEFVRELEFRSCVVNEPLECRPPSRPESIAICTAHFTSSSLSPRKRGIMFLQALVCLSACLPVCLSVCLLPR